MMTKKECFLQRIETVRNRMRENGTNLMMIVPSSHMKYLTGYAIRGDERFLAMVIPAEGPTLAVGNELYRQQMADIPADGFLYWNDGENAVDMLADVLHQRGTATDTIAIDPTMPARFTMALLRAFPQSRLSDASECIDPLRLYKDETERTAMREACAHADEALKRTIGDGVSWLGKTEEDFLARLVYEMTKLGIQEGAACVCTGENASVPHHHPGSSRIEKGKCLLVDFGGIYENYNTDMTRNFYFGQPSDDYVQVYGIVREALQKGKQAAVLGTSLQMIDRAVRDHITACGYGEYFTHRTGHGIGLDCHEGPSVMEGEQTVVAPGMAFSIEPGIYLPGRFGVRIEDQMLITEQGAEALHRYPLDLQIISC